MLTVEPYFNYCCIVWDTISETLAKNLQKLQHAPYTKLSYHILHDVGGSTLAETRQKEKM